MKKRYLFIVVAMAFIAAPAFTETITLQQGPTYSGTSDTHIVSWDGSENQLTRKDDGSNGGSGTAFAGGAPQNAGGHSFIEEGDYTTPHGATPLTADSKCILIKFDVSPVKAVTSAKIGLYYWFSRNGGDAAKEKSGTSQIKHKVNVNRILKDWARGNGGIAGGVDGTDAADNTGGVTWNSTGYEVWQAMGVEGPEDIAPTESVTEYDPAVGGWVWFDVTASAKLWVSDPSKNFGVKIGQEVYDASKFLAPDLKLPNGKMVFRGAPVAVQTDFTSGAYDFVSSSNKDHKDLRPKLVVEGTSSATSWEIFQ